MRRNQLLECIPQRLPHVGALSRELEPSDAFLLAQVDGVSSVEQLCDITPLTQDEVVIRMLKLEHLGMVKLRIASEIADPSAPAIQPSLRPPHTPTALGIDLRQRQEAFGRWRRSISEDEDATTDPPPTVRAR